MGDIADLMLEGALCQSCGEYLGDGDGYPVSCFGCRRSESVERFPKTSSTIKKALQQQNGPHPDGNRAARRAKKFGRIKDEQ